MSPAWIMLHPRMTMQHLGALPMFLDKNDSRPAKEQFDDNYGFAGGWSPMPGWEMIWETSSIQYPGDEPLLPLAMTMLHGETIFYYRNSWVAIVYPPDKRFEVAKLD